MSVDETNKIDFVSLAKDKSCVRLSIADHLDWKEQEGEHLLLLQEKLNAYLHFIESKKLLETYPQADGLPIVIRIGGKFPLGAEATRFFSLAKDKLATLGVSLEFQLVKGTSQTPS
jgi:hypothetical protein